VPLWLCRAVGDDDRREQHKSVLSGLFRRLSANWPAAPPKKLLNWTQFIKIRPVRRRHPTFYSRLKTNFPPER
jgi:hypothetical protein